ncbi:MAG TPA: alpha-amylase family protein [Chitinophagaceae bacterium]|nr:alpha-amylase family protein [Chitinophagaceae bacterium]
MLWYKNALFYSLDVDTFLDANGDGTGDFHGLCDRLEYIADLGCTCLWLLPFYPSPNRDNGYDVKDYFGIDSRLGTMDDFRAFIRKARELDIRILIDLVVNHTSVEHPWFQEARRDRNAPYRDYYVWSDEPLAYEKEHLMLTGEEDTMWTYDPVAGQYYLHRFYKEQPDLNIACPAVRDEIRRIIEFWLKEGVSGFRIDAAEMLIEPYGIRGAEVKELETFLDELRDYVAGINPEAMLLAETNSAPDQMKVYMNGRTRMHMVFNFFVNQYLFLSLATESGEPLARALEQLPEPHPDNQYLNFLRHHDELSLKLLNKGEREAVFQAFAPDEEMRIFDRGIRRRLASMLGNDRQRIEFTYSLLLSLPGTPLIRYGEELGMGEDLSLPGRNSVRTPMQWSAGANGGFSAAPPEKLVRPPIREGREGFPTLNAAQAEADPSSLLHWMRSAIRQRKKAALIGTGRFRLLPAPKPSVLLFCYEQEGQRLLCLHNFSGVPVQLPFPSESQGTPALLLQDTESEINGNEIHLGPYGYLWLDQGQ